MRHKIEKLPAQSFARVELMQEEVLALNNSFKVTFFERKPDARKRLPSKERKAQGGKLRHIEILGKRACYRKRCSQEMDLESNHTNNGTSFRKTYYLPL